MGGGEGAVGSRKKEKRKVSTNCSGKRKTAPLNSVRDS